MIKDKGEGIKVFLCSYNTTITGWGVHFIVWSIHSITQLKSVSNYRYGHPLGSQPDERTWRSIWALHLGAAAWDPVVMPCCLGGTTQKLKYKLYKVSDSGYIYGPRLGRSWRVWVVFLNSNIWLSEVAAFKLRWNCSTGATCAWALSISITAGTCLRIDNDPQGCSRGAPDLKIP